MKSRRGYWTPKRSGWWHANKANDPAITLVVSRHSLLLKAEGCAWLYVPLRKDVRYRGTTGDVQDGHREFWIEHNGLGQYVSYIVIKAFAGHDPNYLFNTPGLWIPIASSARGSKRCLEG